MSLYFYGKYILGNVENIRRVKGFRYWQIVWYFGMAKTTIASKRKCKTVLSMDDALKIADIIGIDVRQLVG
ncbi:MAG: hypothetical protein HDR51_01305 [Treponema sp.]|nr:hypothetical protein [Treponema sp.]